ncbi:hypothetical protein ACTXT7_003963 [Hymenolepis weldensis]
MVMRLIRQTTSRNCTLALHVSQLSKKYCGLFYDTIEPLSNKQSIAEEGKCERVRSRKKE